MVFKKYIPLLFLLFTSLILLAQKPFIKITDITFNREAKVLPAGQGWVILTGDSIRLTKFNSCGFIEWSKQYDMPAVQYGNYDFSALNNGDYALIYRYKKNNVSITAATRFHQNGNIVWSKSYGDNNYNHYPIDILEDNQGNIYLHGMMIDVPVTTTYTYLTKLTANGNLIWTRLFDSGLLPLAAIITSDQGILLKSDGRLLKVDTNGNILWTTVMFYSSFDPIAVSDGFIFASRNWQYYNTEFFKFDNQGNLLWGGAKGISVNSNLPILFNAPGGNITAIFSNPVAGHTYLSFVEFDKDLNLTYERSISLPDSLNGSSLCFLNDGSAIVCGRTSFPQHRLFVARLARDYKNGCDAPLAISFIRNHPVPMGGITYDDSTYTFTAYSESLTYHTVSANVSLLCPPPKFLDLGADTSFCEINFTIGNHTTDRFDFYSWSTGETTASITVTGSGTYVLHVNDSCGESALTDTIIITKLSTADADAGPDLILCENESLILKVRTCDSCSYVWNTGSLTDATVVEAPGIYLVTVQNNNGCIDCDTIEVQEYKCECNIYLPAAFTPNNDSKNETFLPYFYCDLSAYQLMIFNRWGQEVFTTNNPFASWNGKYHDNELPAGVYLYLLKYTAIVNGEKTSPFKKTGALTLIR